LRYANFVLITRNKKVARALLKVSDVTNHLVELLDKTEAGQCKIRLLGVSNSSLAKATGKPNAHQLELFVRDTRD